MRRPTALAIAALALLAGGCDDVGRPPRSPMTIPTTPATPPPPPPAPLPSAPPAPDLAPVAVDHGYLAALPRGPRPRIGYVVHRRYVRPDGSRTVLPSLAGGQSYLGVTAYGAGLLIARTAASREVPGSGDAIALQLDRRGRERARWSCDGFRVDADSGVALWHESGVGVHVGTLATGRDRVLPVRGVRPLALLGPDLLATSPRGRPVLLGSSGERAPLPPGVEELDAVDAVHEATGRAYGHRRGRTFTERTAALGVDTGALAWTSDRWRVRGVSPGGTYAWAISSATGGDPDALGILDAATGAALVELPLLAPKPRRLGDAGAAFEPDGSLLVQVFHPTRTGLTWTVVRVRLDGRVERVLPVLGTRQRYVPPFAFDLSPAPSS